MDVLESLVRETLAEHATDAPSDEGLLDAVTRRRSRRWPVVLSAAAVVVLAAGLAIVLSRDSRRHEVAAGPTSPNTAHPTSTAPTSSAPVAGASMKILGYHGIVIAVPRRLPVLTVPCTLPAEYVLAADPQAAYSCPALRPAPRPTFTVWLATDPGTRGSGQTRYRHIAGFPGSGGVLDVADSPVVVTVTAPTHAQVRAVLTSVRPSADVNGCPATFGKVSNPVTRELVPGSPIGAVRCVYATGRWLLTSIALRSPASLARSIDRLPVYGYAPPETSPTYERDLLLFDLTHGSTRTISMLLNDRPLFSDGHRTLWDPHSRVVELIRRAGP
jgi:hypothetical protein